MLRDIHCAKYKAVAEYQIGDAVNWDLQFICTDKVKVIIKRMETNHRLAASL